MKSEIDLVKEMGCQLCDVMPHVKQKVADTHHALQLLSDMCSWFDVEEYIEFLITDLIHLKSVVTGIEMLENTLDIHISDGLNKDEAEMLERRYLATKNWH